MCKLPFWMPIYAVSAKEQKKEEEEEKEKKLEKGKLRQCTAT